MTDEGVIIKLTDQEIEMLLNALRQVTTAHAVLADVLDTLLQNTDEPNRQQFVRTVGLKILKPLTDVGLSILGLVSALQSSRGKYDA